VSDPTRPPCPPARPSGCRRGEGRDLVGAFRLTDPNGNEVVVRLFADDSDSRAQKLLAAGKRAGMMYPNSFAPHALSWAGGEGWEHRRVYSAARVRFVRVRVRAPAGAVLELRPNFRVWLDAGTDISAQVKRAAEVNKPFAVRLVLKDGVPMIERVAAEGCENEVTGRSP
jgi:hypothetical protein